MENLVGTIVLIFSMVFLIIMIYIIIMYLKNTNEKNKFEEISSKIDDFKIPNLEKKLKDVEAILNFDSSKEKIEEFYNLKDSIVTLTKDSFRKVINTNEKINVLLKNIYNPKPKNIQKILQNLEEIQFHYIIKYLEIRFRIHDLLLNKEIQDSVIYKVRELFSNVSINNKNLIHDEILDSRLFIKKIKKIENEIAKLEDFAFKNIKIENSIIMVKKIISSIQEVDMDLVFLNKSLNFLKLDVPKLYNDFKNIHKQKPEIFNSLFPEFKKTLLELKVEQKESFKSIIELKKRKTYEYLNSINSKLNKLVKLVKLNIESYKFIESYESHIIKLVNEFETKKAYLIDEINRYDVVDKTKRIKYIVEKSQIIQNLIFNYQKLKNETYRKHTPYDLAFSLSKVVEEYQEYINYIRDKVKDINEIIKQTDEINREIARMNVILLDIETKMNSIPKNIQYREQQKLDKLQKATSQIIKIFRRNTEKIELKQKIIVDKLYEEIKILNNQISTDAFAFNYIQWVIIELNKYIHIDEKFANLLSKVEDAYYRADIVEALRISKHITDIYRIYE